MASGGSIKKIHTETMKVAAAVTGGKIVKLTANENEVNLATAATDQPIGVTTEDQATIGEGVEIMIEGETWVTAGAAVAIGARITADASGRGVTAAPAAGTNNGIIGIALSAAAGANNEFRVLVNCPQAFQG